MEYVQRILTIKHNVLNEHWLAAAKNGVVYVIWKDPRTAHSKVGMHTGQNDFICCNDAQPFQHTSPPFTSGGSSKLYLGGKFLGGRPAVLVWKAEQIVCSLQSPSLAHGNTEWEYTHLASSTGSVLYCGCSDGMIEVWNHVKSNRPRVYESQLRGHVGGISGLAVGKDGTLVSVDNNHRNIVRVWCSLKLVATLDLKHEKVHRIACTFERKLYIATEGGSKLWCDLADNRALGGHSPVFSVGTLPTLQLLQPNSGAKSCAKYCAKSCAKYCAKSCIVVKETVYFLCTTSHNRDTDRIEVWRGNEFVSQVDTGLTKLQAWTVSRDGILCCSFRHEGKIRRWKLSKPMK